MKKFRYQKIFMYSSLQFCGHIEEYFAENTQKLVVFIVMPRLKNKYNLVRRYRKGKLIEEKKVWSSSNFFLYYLAWFWPHWWFLLKYFQKNEKFFAFCGHPITLFGMSLQKWLRPKINFICWTGDYFPPTSLPLRLFEKIKKFYHDRITYTCYLGDRINQKMNGKILKTQSKKTVMWGVKPLPIKRSLPQKKFSFLFVGLIKESQGLELFYKFLKENPHYSLKIIGICDDTLYLKHQNLIKKYQIKDQVYFPNKFFSDQELKETSKICHLGIALYNTSKKSSTYYTDPGKVKQYTELGLPVIMSNTSAIAKFIAKFKAGELVERNPKSIKNSLKKIINNYEEYLSGVDKFNQFFYYKNYYRQAFRFMEAS